MIRAAKKRLALLSLSAALLLAWPVGAFAGTDTGTKFGHTYKFTNGYISNGAWAQTYFSDQSAPKEVTLTYTYRNLSNMTVVTTGPVTNASSTSVAYALIQVPNGISQQPVSGYSSHLVNLGTPSIINTYLPI
ncbi:hypothetical protein [Paenibacillus radicis (ex Gao et al. 2016)]|uniref:Uncharacterized protein n=1 Tax=Paenibacillus radicis (ex Gao et al. 2016) TaxID=1737354 RepID=A0A917LYL0_9BACL|nr:hypothetical protein [Paenibacillus radicis (ex Gao et al. 2016)]GGG65692.1 hypothetical protein GCM10010918_20010 [Paenibacillus radicis (ex Gao et al. 2016)]